MIILKIKKNFQEQGMYLITSDAIDNNTLYQITDTVKHLIEKGFIDTYKPTENEFTIKELFPEGLGIKVKLLTDLKEVIINV